jgi:UDP-N-acetylglucosamine transferase subunit ALG13
MTTLLVAATGGHLKQLHLLHRRMDDLHGPFEWVTFDRPQSRSLLAGERVHYVPYIGQRDPSHTALGFRQAAALVRRGRVGAVVSTGSAIALPYLSVARARRIRGVYVESAARVFGRSLTGRMLETVRGLELRTQYAHSADDRWTYRGSVFDVFRADAAAVGGDLKKVVVTLGTLHFDFRRLVDNVRRVLPEDALVLWQVGGTDPAGLGERAHAFMPEHELLAAMRDADLVIAHAGVGSALTALEAGKAPVLVPRRAAHREHVDDHQEQIARELLERGLAVSCEADELSRGHLELAAALRVSMVPATDDLELALTLGAQPTPATAGAAPLHLL